MTLCKNGLHQTEGRCRECREEKRRRRNAVKTKLVCGVAGCSRVVRFRGRCRSHLDSEPYVDGRELGRLLASWIERWNLDHEKPPWDPSCPKDPTIEVYDLLAERTVRSGRKVTAWEIRFIAAGRRPYVPFYEVADPLACAMRCPYVFVDGMLPVFGEALTGTPPPETIDLQEAA